MNSIPTPLPAGLARHKQLLLVALAGTVVAVCALVLLWLGAGSVSAQVSDTTFSPSVTITVPLMDSDGDGVKDYAGVSFVVEFDAVENSDDGCTDFATGTYVVQNGGAVTALNGAPVLVDRPAGVTSNCSYDVTFPEYIEPEPGATLAEDREALYLRRSNVAPVSGSAVVVGLVSYETAHSHSGEPTSFDPSMIVTVPDVTGQDGNNEFSGTRIWLSYSSDTLGCHEKVFEKFSVASGGAVSEVGDAVRLDTRPGGATTGELCVYDVGVAKSSDDLLGLPSSVSHPEVDGDNSSEEIALVVTFSPELSLGVPLTDSNNDGVVDYAGTRIAIDFYRTRSYWDRGCPSGLGVSYILESNGTLVRQNPDQSIVLPKYLAGQVTGRFCHFTVRVSVHYGPGISNLPDSPDILHLDIAPRSSEYNHRSQDIVTFKFRSIGINLNTRFSANVSASISAAGNVQARDFAGHSVVISATPVDGSVDSCTRSADWTYRINNDGSIAKVTPTSNFLVDRPAGGASRCSYQVKFPEYIVPRPGANVSADIEALYLETNTVMVVDNSSVTRRTVSATYMATHALSGSASSFVPLVSVSVPLMRGQSMSTAFSGERIWLSYSSGTQGCNKKVFEKYLVDANGMVSRVGGGVSLYSRPGGAAMGDLCVYSVNFAESSSDDLDAPRDTNLPQVYSASRQVLFALAQTAFSPNVSIIVPLTDEDDDQSVDYEGVRFTLTYNRTVRSPVGCPSGTLEIYEVQPDGSLELDGLPASLPKKPIGEVSRPDCVYSVVNSVDHGDNFSNPPPDNDMLQNQDSLVPTVSFANRDASLRFRTVISLVDNIFVTVPLADEDNNEISDFSNVVVHFTSTPKKNLQGNCGHKRRLSFVGQDDGSMRVSSSSATTLVGRPAGLIEYCEYDIVFNELSSSSTRYDGDLLFLLDVDSSVLSPISIASARYGSLFEFSANVSVPDVDVDADRNNDFLSQKIIITYRKTVGSHDYCDDFAVNNFARHVFTIQGDGSTISTHPPYPQNGYWLRDRLPGLLSRCEYSITFDEPGGNFKVRTHNISVINYDDEILDATYDVVIPKPVSVQVPAAAARDANLRSLTVRYRPISGADSRCPQLTEEHYNVDADGIVTPQNEAFSLLYSRVVADGADYTCAYNIELPDLMDLDEPTDIPGRVDISSEKYIAIYSTSDSPDVSIKVPIILGDDGNSIFSGEEFTVSYRKASGFDDKCIATGEDSYIVQPSGTVMLQGGASQVRLVDDLGNIEELCAYELVIDNDEDRLVLKAGGVGTYNLAEQDFAVVYVTEFEPSVTINVNVSEDEIDNYSGTEFLVNFARSGSETGCTALAQDIYWVTSSGTVALKTPESRVRLANHVGGVSTACSYVVTISVGEDKFMRQDTGNISVSASDNNQVASYMSIFTPNVTLSLPDVDINNDGKKDFVGDDLTVSYRKISTANDTCSMPVDETFEVQNGGATVRKVGTAEARLVGRLVGETTACSYDITWPVIVGIHQQSGASTGVSVSDRDISTIYHTVFSHDVVIILPDIDENSDSINDFLGNDLIVRYSKISTANTGCSLSEYDTFEVQNDGSVMRKMGTVSARLVDRIGGVANACKYNVVWPDIEGLHWQSSASSEVSKTEDSISAEYYNMFNPIMNISVPNLDVDSNDENDFSDTVFTVSYERVQSSNDVCTLSASVSYIVDDRGSVERKVDSPEASLVGLIGDDSVGCEYNVIVTTAANNGLKVDGTDEFMVRNADRSKTVSYISAFSLDVMISVPAHIMLETSIRVSYVPVTDHDGCVAEMNYAYKLKVSDNGSKTFRWPLLVDYPDAAATNVRCSYRVEWKDTQGLVLDSSTGQTVSATSNILSATYIDGFYPIVTIMAPEVDANSDGANDFDGRVVTVVYSPKTDSNPGCSPRTSENYVIDSTGAAGRQEVGGVMSRVGLIDRPTGAAMSVSCVYDVAWSDVSGMQLASGASATISNSGKKISASYYNVFEPVVTIQVPVVDGTNGTNVFSHTDFNEFEFSYTRTSTSDTRCIVSGTDTFVVNTEGTVIPKPGESRVSLTDRIGGVVDACSYRAQFPLRVKFPPPPENMLPTPDLVLQPPENDDDIVESDESASAAYNSVFSPDVTVDLPVGAIGFSGKGFEVRYEPASMSMSSCAGYGAMGEGVDDAIERYIINSEGSVQLAGGMGGQTNSAWLVDSTAGSSTRCEYNANFDSVIASNTYGYSAANSNTVSATERLNVRYHNMSYIYPLITVSVANIDKNDDNIHDLTGSEIMVSFVSASDNEFCSVDVKAILIIQNSGNNSIENSDVQLAAGQPRSDTTCSYNVIYDIIYSANASEKLVIQTGYTASVNLISFSVEAIFSAGVVPSVDISVPQLNASNGANKFSGTELPVTFAHSHGPESNCSDSIVATYVVQDNGTVSTGDDFVLLDYTWENGTKDDTCLYSASFDAVVGGLHLQASGQFDYGVGRSNITAAYDAKFEPKIEIGFPLPVNGSVDDTNEMFRSRIWFTSTQEGCDNNVSQRFKVLGSGKIEFIGDVLNLLDGDSEATSSCSYSVTVPESLEDGSYATETTSPGNVSADGDPLVIEYTSKFVPQLSFRISRAGSGSQNNFIDDEIFANFEASGDPNSGCSNRATVVYIVESAESAILEGDELKLVDSIPVYVEPGVGEAKGSFNTVRCEYNVSLSFPQNRLEYSGGTIAVSGALPSSLTSPIPLSEMGT